MKKTNGIGTKILLLAVFLEVIAVVIILSANAGVKRGSDGVDFVYNYNLKGVLYAAEIKAEINDAAATAGNSESGKHTAHNILFKNT